MSTLRYPTAVESRPYHHGDLRAQLLDAALEVLETRGRDNLSLRELARTLGVSHGAPARHFADRQALLDGLTERGLLELGVAIEQAMRGVGAGFGDQFGAFARAYVSFARVHPELLRLMNETKDRPGAPALNQLAEQTFRLPVQAVAQARAEGTLRDPDGATLEDVLEALLLGLGQLVVAGRSAPRVDATVTAATEALTRGLRPRSLPPES